MFDIKQKEPLLSDKLQNIIGRSIGENKNSDLDPIIRYKHKIMQMLVADQDLLHTLHNTELSEGKEVINGDKYRDICIFNYMKLPDNKSKSLNYVCFEVQDRDSYDCLSDIQIIFRVVVHEDDQKTDYGIPRDTLLSLIIKNKFDWTNSLGMHFEKNYDVAQVTDDNYYYREISYTVTASNNVSNKINNLTYGK